MMFDPSDTPRLFGVPLGHDFSRALFNGLIERFARLSPEQIARAEIFVNTRRMQRRLTGLFLETGSCLLPRIRLITELGQMVGLADIPAPCSALRRRLEIAQLVRALIEADPSIAAKDSAFDLADSLVALMGEMQGEGVTPDVIAALDVNDQSGHWQRALSFISLVQEYFGEGSQPDAEGRQRRVIEHQIEQWDKTPPNHPIIVAGSTGSRGATTLFMQAVAKLSQGAVILPGIDTHMPAFVWDMLSKDTGGEDHPQFRFKALCDVLGIHATQIPTWCAAAKETNGRSALISLSLRPAPVTDQWISDGAKLGDVANATKGLTLIEAPTPRAEAEAIAARLRQAVDDGETAALISPDRMLTRQVTAALDRWGIVPDDSAGLPLQLTAPGRLLRHVADHMCAPLTAERLLILLRHPLTNTQPGARGAHNLHTNALELELRRNGPPFPTPQSLRSWAEETGDKHPDRAEWVSWIEATLFANDAPQTRHLEEHVTDHIEITERLSGGPGASDSGDLWKETAGREAIRQMSELRLHADVGGTMSARDYRHLVGRILSGGEVRDRDAGDPRVLIWGTLEARVQSADLVILGGMNEGTWPEAPTPDPWLNRSMRLAAGLLLPERRIGLSAHDYQQAVCAKSVVISRSIRSDEAQTVPSRWVNRLMNLLGGLTETGGPDCLEAMRRRGDAWLARAERIAAPKNEVDRARRPSPCPPSAARPNRLSVTQIKTLIRDPYAIYARHILGLNALNPLSRSADAPLRGIIVHEVLERFLKSGIDPSSATAEADLMALADKVLQEECPWPAMRTLWRARIAAFVPHFLSEEAIRQANSTNIDTEMWGELYFAALDFTLTGKADRIDLSEDGEALIYDYKTGKAPTKNQQKLFDKQLLLEAGMVQRGAFKGVGVLRTKSAVYIGLGSDLTDQPAPLDESPPEETLRRFEGLIARWQDPTKGYTSRRANETLTHVGDYDHLARHGEWDETDTPQPEAVS